MRSAWSCRASTATAIAQRRGRVPRDRSSAASAVWSGTSAATCSCARSCGCLGWASRRGSCSPGRRGCSAVASGGSDCRGARRHGRVVFAGTWPPPRSARRSTERAGGFPCRARRQWRALAGSRSGPREGDDDDGEAGWRAPAAAGGAGLPRVSPSAAMAGLARVAFTGERLPSDDPCFGADLARHLAAYHLARPYCVGKRVLDAGCGEGYGAALLAEVAAQVVGVDRSWPALARARARYRGNLLFACANLEQLGALGCRFDVACNFQVVEHFAVPEQLLEQ